MNVGCAVPVDFNATELSWAYSLTSRVTGKELIVFWASCVNAQCIVLVLSLDRTKPK